MVNCHGLETGSKPECRVCPVLYSCVSKWNKDLPKSQKKNARTIKGENDSFLIDDFHTIP